MANVVAFYRQQLDAILEQRGLRKSSTGKSKVSFIPDLNKTFNRGYSTYFLHGRGDSIGSVDSPKMVGELLGRVVKVLKQGVVLDGKVPIHAGDGLCYFNPTGQLRGTSVNAAVGQKIVLNESGELKKGMKVYRNHDHEFMTRIRKSSMQRRIGVSMTLKETLGGVSLEALDEDGCRAEYAYPGEFEPAEKADQALSNIRKQLMKTGDSEFECSEVQIELNQPVFFPLSILNTMRREILTRLSEVRQESRPVLRRDHQFITAPFPEKELSFEGNVLNRYAEAFYRRQGVTLIEQAAESGMDLRGRKVMTTRYCVREQLGLCPKDCAGALPADPLHLTDEEGHQLGLRFICGKCEMEVYWV